MVIDPAPSQAALSNMHVLPQAGSYAFKTRKPQSG
jgi:hypothetical protein